MDRTLVGISTIVILVGLTIWFIVSDTDQTKKAIAPPQTATAGVADSTPPWPFETASQQKDRYPAPAPIKETPAPPKETPAVPSKPSVSDKSAFAAFKASARQMDPEGLILKKFVQDDKYIQVTVDDFWYSMQEHEKERFAKSLALIWWESSGGKYSNVEVYDSWQKLLAFGTPDGITIK